MVATRSTALALLLVFVAVAGCNALPDTASESDDPTASATPIPVESPTPTWTSTPTPHSHTEVYPIGDRNLGEHEEPHRIRIVNTRNETLMNVSFQLTHEDGEGSYEPTYTLLPDETQSGLIVSKANYTVTVTVGDQNATEHLSKALFDCNDSTTTFTITRDNITTRTISTAVGCPTESPD